MQVLMHWRVGLSMYPLAQERQANSLQLMQLVWLHGEQEVEEATK